MPRAYEVYYTHDESDERVPEAGMDALMWRLIHGYLNHRFGMNRQPASPWGVRLFAALPPLRLKLDYYGRHLFASRYPQRGRLLDVGCGNGTFLARAGEMGWEPIGLEPDPKAVATCRQQGLYVVEGILAAAPKAWLEQFDVVTLIHAIEHVPDPVADLKRCFELLRPGGTLWLALPNPQGLGAMAFQSSWRGLHAPYHLAILSQDRLRKLLLESGFHQIHRLRRGVHAKFIIRESADIARHEKTRAGSIRAALAPLIRMLADVAASFDPRLGEETVLTARRPSVP